MKITFFVGTSVHPSFHYDGRTPLSFIDIAIKLTKINRVDYIRQELMTIPDSSPVLIIVMTNDEARQMEHHFGALRVGRDTAAHTTEDILSSRIVVMTCASFVYAMQNNIFDPCIKFPHVIRTMYASLYDDKVDAILAVGTQHLHQIRDNTRIAGVLKNLVPMFRAKTEVETDETIKLLDNKEYNNDSY